MGGLQEILKKSTSKDFAVRGVVLFPAQFRSARIPHKDGTLFRGGNSSEHELNEVGDEQTGHDRDTPKPDCWGDYFSGAAERTRAMAVYWLARPRCLHWPVS
jgi:hypothetical protein